MSTRHTLLTASFAPAALAGEVTPCSLPDLRPTLPPLPAPVPVPVPVLEMDPIRPINVLETLRPIPMVAPARAR